MKNLARKLSFALFIWCSFSLAADISNSGTIMDVGTFHRGEIADKPGRGWLALISNSESAELRPVKPRIKTVFDPVGDNEDDKASYTGKEVILKGIKPVLLIQVNGLVAGKIDQAQISSQEHGQNLHFNGASYQITHRCKPKDPATGFSACKVYFTGSGSSQWLGDTSENDDSDFAHTLTVKWAGEIDRDGKLDLIVEKDSYNNGDTVLMLSRAAKKGQLVGEVASLSRQGC